MSNVGSESVWVGWNIVQKKTKTDPNDKAMETN